VVCAVALWYVARGGRKWIAACATALWCAGQFAGSPPLTNTTSTTADIPSDLVDAPRDVEARGVDPPLLPPSPFFFLFFSIITCHAWRCTNHLPLRHLCSPARRTLGGYKCRRSPAVGRKRSRSEVQEALFTNHRMVPGCRGAAPLLLLL
jgi:hypothetical protein